MNRIMDPFPPTPERFHLRVEEALRTLEDKDMNRKRVYRKSIVLAAAILAALLALTAVAAVMGNTIFKDELKERGAAEVADLVQEVHRTAEDADGTDFSFSVDELIWEDSDLYVSYSLTVPQEGRYMVVMEAPVLNGEKLACDAKGFSGTGCFFDPDEFGCQAVLLLGGQHPRSCGELWTLKADPQYRSRTDNGLFFRAVLLKTDLDMPGAGVWDEGALTPPDAFSFSGNWRSEVSEEYLHQLGEDQAARLDDVAAAFGPDGVLTLDELISTGCAEYVAERTIDLTLDASALPQALYNDVAEHDFDVKGVHLHVDRFRMTHLGVELNCTVSAPGLDADEARRRLNAFFDLSTEWTWDFGTIDGRDPGFSLGGDGGVSRVQLEDGTVVYRVSWRQSCVQPLTELRQLIYAPMRYPEGAEEPEYDMENAVILTPVYSEAVAAAEASATPTPAPEPQYDEGEFDLSN